VRTFLLGLNFSYGFRFGFDSSQITYYQLEILTFVSPPGGKRLLDEKRRRRGFAPLLLSFSI